MASRRQRRQQQRRAQEAPKPVEALEAEVEVETTERVPALTRHRPPKIRLTEEQKREIVAAVKRYAKEDMEDRRVDMEEREQHHAKIHQVTDGSGRRWSGSSDVAIPDIAAACFQEEDTLSNAVLSQMPICEAKAENPDDREREMRISMLDHHQLFVEQDGEALVDDLVADFVRDGVCTLLTTWVREKRETTMCRRFERIDPKLTPKQHFERILRTNMGMTQVTEVKDSGGWDWRVGDAYGQFFDASFYTDDETDEVILELTGETLVFSGPKDTRIAYENALHPYYCANLQPKGPSNPNGASHVIIVDTPSVGEVKRLIRDGEYNRITVGDLEGAESLRQYERDRRLYEVSIEHEIDAMRGFDQHVSRRAGSEANHGLLTRYICYETWERPDGTEIEVVFTVFPQLDLLARAVPLGEDCPIVPQMRPLSEGRRIPVPSRRIGLSLPQTMTGTHDQKKAWVDLMFDAGEIEILPMFTYLERSSIDPRDYSIYPGAGWPTRSQGDIQTFQFSPQSGAVGLNNIGLLDQMQDEIAMRSELQAGRVPRGSSSALRNKGTVQELLLQAEARPQKLLSRFFACLRHRSQVAWGLNVHYQDPKKVFRVLGAPNRNEELIELQDGDLSPDIRFTFQASIFNASKTAQQQGLESFFQIVANPLMLELGIAQADGIYRMAHKMGQVLGVDPDRYISAPSPEAEDPPVSARAAMGSILLGETPFGRPQEGAEPHVQELLRLFQVYAGGADIRGVLNANQQIAFAAWIKAILDQAQQEAQQQRQVAAAQQFQAAQQQNAQPGAPGTVATPSRPGPVGQNDLADERLAGSGTPG